jgi:hypothetical protein
MLGFVDFSRADVTHEGHTLGAELELPHQIRTSTLCGRFPERFTTECERAPQLVRPREQLLQRRPPNVGTGP